MNQRRAFAISFFSILLLFIPAHSTFQSRTTHGTAWTGQVSLESDNIRITVKPSYLDVEEEIILGAYSTSGQTPTGDQNTLEIYGGFTLPTNSVIVGMLIWRDDSTILKGKLKPKGTAQAQYESVIDRSISVPPKPRDPLIIEQTSANTYNFAVYPVVWGNVRKVRIRYLIPQQFASGELQMPFYYVFGLQVQKLPNWFQINLKSDSTLPRIIFNDGQTVSTVQLPTTVMKQYSSATMNIKLPAANKVSLVTTNFLSGIWKGSFLMLWTKVPDSIFIKSSAAVNGNLTSVSLSIKNDKKKYSFNLASTLVGGLPTFQPFIFASQSLFTWSNQLEWTGFNANGDILATHSEVPPASTKELDTALVKTYAGSNVAFSEIYTGGGLGYVFGVVDFNYSLLALESDTVDALQRIALADNTVPFLLDSEIFKPAVVALKNNRLEKTARSAISIITTARNSIRINFAQDIGINEIKITDLRGRLLAIWPKTMLFGKAYVEWDKKDYNGKALGMGVYLVTVLCKDGITSRQIIVSH